MNIEEAIVMLKELPKKLADAGVSIMKEEVPVRSGALRDSIKADINGETITITAGGEKAPYAASVNYGHKAYTVTPNSASVLHWNAPYGNKNGDVFAMRADIPATKGNDFVQRTLDRLNNFNI